MTKIGRRGVTTKKDPKDLTIERLKKENQGLKEHIVDLESLNRQLDNDNNDLSRENTRLTGELEEAQERLDQAVEPQ